MALPGFKVTLGSERVLSLIGHCVCVDEGHVGETFFIYMYINSKTVCFLSYQWIIWGGVIEINWSWKCHILLHTIYRFS